MPARYRYSDPTPEPVLLIGGPVHKRRTNLSKKQVENGYEFVDSGSYGLKSTSESPHSHWRSARYKFLTKLDGINIMVHESVTEPSAWTFSEKLEDARGDFQKAVERQQKLNREISEAERNVKEATSERDALKERLKRVKKFNELARTLLEEVEDA